MENRNKRVKVKWTKETNIKERIFQFIKERISEKKNVEKERE